MLNCTKARKYVFCCLLAALITAPGCMPSCKTKASPLPLQKDANAGDLAALVNGISIKKSDLDSLHTRALDKYKNAGKDIPPEFDQKLRASFLKKMIDDELIKQKAESVGVKVDRFERVEAFEKYQDKIGGRRVFEIYLQREGLTEEQVQRVVLGDLQKEKLIAKLSPVKDPGDQEIQDFYQANQTQYFQPEMVHARHILLRVDAKDSKEKAQNIYQKAQQIFKEASATGASFVKLAEKYSDGPSAKTGGDLGKISRGRMVKEFEDVIFKAPLKTPVGPVKTDFGYHIVYVEEKYAPSPAPLNQVRDHVIEALKRNKRAVKGEEILISMRKSADVTIYDQSMTKDDYKKINDPDQMAASSDVKK